MVRRDRTYQQVFTVPREPLVALVSNQAGGDLISNETVESASRALYWVGVFNQLVQQQTDYNGLHVAEIRGDATDDAQREAIAEGAFSISRMIHGTAIGRANQQGGWYQALTQHVEANLDDLDKQAKRPWWVTKTVGAAALAVVLGVALAGWTLIDSDTSDRPHRHAPLFMRGFDG